MHWSGGGEEGREGGWASERTIPGHNIFMLPKLPNLESAAGGGRREGFSRGFWKVALVARWGNHKKPLIYESKVHLRLK